MNIKPQDVLVLLKLISLGSRDLSFAALAKSLYMSPAEVHAAVRRAQKARLYAEVTRQTLKKNFAEYLVHGVKYSFPAEIGGRARGMATSYAAAPLNAYLELNNEPLVPVWPTADGMTSGLSFSPLYPSVPLAASQDATLYELRVPSSMCKLEAATKLQLTSQ